MSTLAMFLGLIERPACEPCLDVEREERRSNLEALLASIAEVPASEMVTGNEQVAL
jgi:hypothetical protein